AIAETHGECVTAVNLGVLTIKLAADLGEAIGGNQPIAESLALLFIASDALRKPEADVLQMDEVIDPGGAVERGTAAITYFSEIVSKLQVSIATLLATLHRSC